MRPPLLPRQRKLRAAAAAAIVLLLSGLAALPPVQKGVVDFPGCLFHKMTGLPCPLCGGTRAASALMHGNIHRAVELNPLSLVAVAILLAVAAIASWESVRGRTLADWPVLARRAGPWIPVLVLLLLVWWLPHVWGALRGPKSELLDLRNPIARGLHEDLRVPGR